MPALVRERPFYETVVSRARVNRVCTFVKKRIVRVFFINFCVLLVPWKSAEWFSVETTRSRVARDCVLVQFEAKSERILTVGTCGFFCPYRVILVIAIGPICADCDKNVDNNESAASKLFA